MGQHKNQIGSVGESSTASQNLNSFNNQKTGSRGFNRSQVPPNMQGNMENNMMMNNSNMPMANGQSNNIGII